MQTVNVQCLALLAALKPPELQHGLAASGLCSTVTLLHCLPLK